MKIQVEVHETAKRKPTKKGESGGDIMAYDRALRCWSRRSAFWVADDPEQYPIWFSLKGFPKPAPLRARKK